MLLGIFALHDHPIQGERSWPVCAAFENGKLRKRRQVDVHLPVAGQHAAQEDRIEQPFDDTRVALNIRSPRQNRR